MRIDPKGKILHETYEERKDSSHSTLLTEQWNLELDALTGTREYPADKLEILSSGEEAFSFWRNTLLTAQNSIRLYTYYLRSDRTLGKELVQILEKKARSGVSVRILTSRYAQIACGYRDILRLRRAGCRVILAGNIGYSFTGRSCRKRRNRIVAPVPEGLGSYRKPPWKKRQRLIDFSLHAKMLIVDGDTAITGGRNIHKTYFTNWEDADLFFTGPAALNLAKRFDREFLLFKGGPPSAPISRPSSAPQPIVRVRTILSNPWDQSYSTMETIIHAIESARSSIEIMTQYIIPPKRLLEALKAAARRGTEVHLLTNSRASGTEVLGATCWYISTNWYKDLLEAGIHIHEWYGRNTLSYLHTKFFLVDRRWCAIGSYNLSLRSSFLESEILCAFHSEPHIAEASNFFTSARTQCCKEVRPEDLSEYSTVTRLLQKAALLLKIMY